ncbi:M15 family metallopeptidase [Cytobacillus sp. FSL H8-0458]|uniref:M15 family metallopeptidase n=1 Tax=Cytobacillus sp. FSL H8-0458 TaxID=2975346 RepID=UPI0030FAAA9A
MNLDYLLDRANNKLSGVHTSVKLKALELVEKAHSEGIYVLITQGLRSIEEQNGLYAQGRTKSGKIVTNARGGYSYHNFGLAFDFAILDTPSKVNWNVDKRWRRVGEIGESLGLEWGGRWTSFRDYPHFQLTFGLSLANLRAGKKPPVVKPTVQKPGAKKEEDHMLEKAIVINAFPDFPFAEVLAARIKAPIYTRSALPKGKIAKEVYVVGGTKNGLQADKVISLTGADRFEVARAVENFLK